MQARAGHPTKLVQFYNEFLQGGVLAVRRSSNASWRKFYNKKLQITNYCVV